MCKTTSRASEWCAAIYVCALLIMIKCEMKTFCSIAYRFLKACAMSSNASILTRAALSVIADYGADLSMFCWRATLSRVFLRATGCETWLGPHPPHVPDLVEKRSPRRTI